MKLFIFKHYLNISSTMKEARPTTNITAAQWREVRKVFNPNSQYDQVSFLKVLRTTYEVGEIADGDDARCRVVITAMLVVLVIMIMMVAVVILLRYWRARLLIKTNALL